MILGAGVPAVEEINIENMLENSIVSMLNFLNLTTMLGLYKKILFFNDYFFILRQRESRGGAERGEERESQAGSTLSVQSLMQGSNSQTVRS